MNCQNGFPGSGRSLIVEYAGHLQLGSTARLPDFALAASGFAARSQTAWSRPPER